MSQKRLWWRWVLLIVSTLLAASGIAGYIYLQPYEASDYAKQQLTSTASVTVADQDKWILFEPNRSTQTSIIFYPGGLVEPESYAPFASRLAESGYRTYIVKMPLHLAVLGIDRALEIQEQDTNETLIMGGHSLGGSMAARYAAEQDGIDGLFLLAAYAEEGGDLSKSSMPVLSISGDKDGILNMRNFREGKAFLPDDARYEKMQGANHAQFGSYGPQDGDEQADIERTEQVQRTVTLLSEWINNFR
ncbi:alpha/beta hydrolase [Pontibacillus salicampi]|uniref:Alpha/beta hydrolase n=1 Tax=Pontibacillus salicampi TaxID=1449801 RepID=A0ABV6LTH7_9BACI